MKRRNFLKTLVGVVGAVAVGAKVAPASAVAPVALAPPAPPVPSYVAAPRGLAYLVNNGSTFIGLSRVSYPDLSAPTPDAHGPALTRADFERLKKTLRKKGRKDA